MKDHRKLGRGPRPEAPASGQFPQTGSRRSEQPADEKNQQSRFRELKAPELGVMVVPNLVAIRAMLTKACG